MEKDGKNYVTVDVLIADNTADLFVVSYRVTSKDKLTPVNFEKGNFGDKNLTLNATDTINPSSVTSKNLTGIQVLHDSSSGLKGISAKAGVLGTAWFEAPTKDGTYTFVLENLGCNNVYTDETGKMNVGTYNISLDSEVQFTVGKGDEATLLPQICDQHNFTVDVEDGKKCEDCDTIKHNDGSIIYPTVDVAGNASSDKGASSKNSEFKEGKNNKAPSDYVIPIMSAVVIAAVIIVAVVIFTKRKKK